ncbi:hypothetical protein AOA62_26555 [Pseudomonas sp. 2995-3]|nr:hypothetical protein AOA62_26555 [Pseudomonas sp. 2995-3]
MVVLLNKAPGAAPMSEVWSRARDGAIAARVRCRPMWLDIKPHAVKCGSWLACDADDSVCQLD